MFNIHKMFPVEWNMSLTNTHELFVSGTHQVPAGRSDIIPPACCGLSSLLFPIQRTQKVSLARHHNHNTFTESFCWFAADALLHSVCAELCYKQKHFNGNLYQISFFLSLLTTYDGATGEEEHSRTNTHITAAARPIYQNTHPNYLICHSTQ